MSARAFGRPARFEFRRYVFWTLRGLLASFVVGPSVLGVVELVKEPDKGGWLVFTAIVAVVVFFVMRWLGGGRGVLWGAWLALLSFGFLGGIENLACLVGLGIATICGREIDALNFVGAGIFGIGLTWLCGWGLQRCDPDGGRA